MNVQLPLVLSDIMGETGQKILRAIVAGERDPLTLAQLRHPSCKSPEDEIAKALTGTWQPEHLFALKQSLEIVDFFTHQLADCDAELERQFAAVKPRWEVPLELPSLPKAKPGSRSKNQPAYPARAELYRITGVDLVAVEGISASLAQTIISEVGTNMSRFPTEKDFCSWLGLTPHHEISGGKILRNHNLKNRQPCGTSLSSSRRLCHPQSECFRRVLSPQESPTGSDASAGGYRSQNRPHRLSLTQRQNRVSRHRDRKLRATISRTRTRSLAPESRETRLRPHRHGSLSLSSPASF